MGSRKHKERREKRSKHKKSKSGKSATTKSKSKKHHKKSAGSRKSSRTTAGPAGGQRRDNIFSKLHGNYVIGVQNHAPGAVPDRDDGVVFNFTTNTWTRLLPEPILLDYDLFMKNEGGVSTQYKWAAGSAVMMDSALGPANAFFDRAEVSLGGSGPLISDQMQNRYRGMMQSLVRGLCDDETAQEYYNATFTCSYEESGEGDLTKMSRAGKDCKRLAHSPVLIGSSLECVPLLGPAYPGLLAKKLGIPPSECWLPPGTEVIVSLRKVQHLWMSFAMGRVTPTDYFNKDFVAVDVKSSAADDKFKYKDPVDQTEKETSKWSSKKKPGIFTVKLNDVKLAVETFEPDQSSVAASNLLAAKGVSYPMANCKCIVNHLISGHDALDSEFDLIASCDLAVLVFPRTSQISGRPDSTKLKLASTNYLIPPELKELKISIDGRAVAFQEGLKNFRGGPSKDRDAAFYHKYLQQQRLSGPDSRIWPDDDTGIRQAFCLDLTAWKTRVGQKIKFSYKFEESSGIERTLAVLFQFNRATLTGRGKFWEFKTL